MKWRFLQGVGSFVLIIGMISGCVAPEESSKSENQQQNEKEATSTNLPKETEFPQPKLENEVKRSKGIQATVEEDGYNSDKTKQNPPQKVQTQAGPM